VLIHCKGGRGRAATMLLCYYISKGKDPRETLEWMRSKRKEVVSSILHYRVVEEIEQKYKHACNK
jgi:protein-tyrosine phosphatase